MNHKIIIALKNKQGEVDTFHVNEKGELFINGEYAPLQRVLTRVYDTGRWDGMNRPNELGPYRFYEEEPI